MRFYSLRPARFTRQVIADLFMVAWVLGWIRLGDYAQSFVTTMRQPADQLAQAGTRLEDGMQSAAATAADLPLVGATLRGPFDSLATTGGSVRQTGEELSESVRQLADVAGWVVTLLPILLVGVVWLVARVRFVRRAYAAQRYIDAAPDLDLFALRAMARQPMERLARLSDDPTGAWRRRDPAMIRALADLELRDCGIHPERAIHAASARP